MHVFIIRVEFNILFASVKSKIIVFHNSGLITIKTILFNNYLHYYFTRKILNVINLCLYYRILNCMLQMLSKLKIELLSSDGDWNSIYDWTTVVTSEDVWKLYFYSCCKLFYLLNTN